MVLVMVLVIFGVDISPSVDFDKGIKDVLLLGEGITQGLDDTTVTAEALLILLNQIRKFVQVCITMEVTVSLYDSGVKTYQFKGNESEIKAYRLCLGSIPENFTDDNMKKVC